MLPAKPSDEELTNLANQAIQKLKTIIDSPKWEKINDKPCLMLKLEIDGRLASRGEAKVGFPAQQVFEFLLMHDTLSKLNDQLKSTKELYVIKGEHDIFVDRAVYKGIWPVSDRDFVSVATSFKEGDCYYIATQACNYPEPEQKGVVRGKIFTGGYKIIVVDEKTCHVIYVSDADLMGSIPGMVKNQVGKKQGQVASKIQPTMKKG